LVDYRLSSDWEIGGSISWQTVSCRPELGSVTLTIGGRNIIDTEECRVKSGGWIQFIRLIQEELNYKLN